MRSQTDDQAKGGLTLSNWKRSDANGEISLGHVDRVESVPRKPRWAEGGAAGLTALIYDNIRGVTRLVDRGLAKLAPLAPPTNEKRLSLAHEAVVAFGKPRRDSCFGDVLPKLIQIACVRSGPQTQVVMSVDSARRT
jgi:hypothetical protein